MFQDDCSLDRWECSRVREGGHKKLTDPNLKFTVSNVSSQNIEADIIVSLSYQPGVDL